jgi:hypothetical protein
VSARCCFVYGDRGSCDGYHRVCHDRELGGVYGKMSFLFFEGRFSQYSFPAFVHDSYASFICGAYDNGDIVVDSWKRRLVSSDDS